MLARVKVLLAHDGSAEADVARALVGSLAWAPGTIVRVVGVIEPVPADLELPPEAHAALKAALERETARRLEDVAAGLRERGLAVDVVARVGRPASVIVDEASRSGAALVVVGSRGRGAIARTLLGSVAAEVIDHAPCPVLVARGPAIRRALLAEDGSAPARAAAQLLSEWPALRGLPVHVVSVLPLRLESTSDPTEHHATADPREAAAVDRAREASRALAHQTAARLAAEGLDAHYAVRAGDVAGELVQAACEFGADVIAMGTRGRTGLERLFLGSVARKVLYSAGCSVLVVRGASR